MVHILHCLISVKGTMFSKLVMCPSPSESVTLLGLLDGAGLQHQIIDLMMEADRDSFQNTMSL
jgi:hypothetical protein